MAEDETTVKAGKGGVRSPAVALAATEAVRAAADAAVGRGATIGRYLALDRLGAGGMGVVYAAYDPELNRRVAIKVLRPGWGSEPNSAGRARLQREAQALARLTHPNVIPVYDVGTYGDGVFMAMELVDGGTLRAWRHAAPRSWREIRDVYRLAGAGLAAAHEANLVHRDFKPENALIGHDGRVRVTDFGLAREAAAAPGDDPSPPGPGSAPLEPITHTGALVGTPPYMSPEQHRGKPADARSDQWSFCTALYEALVGEHPFARETPELQSLAIYEGVVNPLPAGARVPAWLQRVVLRGLRADPAARWPSMTALVAALGHDRVLRQRRALAVAVLVAAAGAALSIGVGRRLATPARPDACAAGDRLLAGIWDRAAADRVDEAFLATGLPYAADSAVGVTRTLDAWAADWTAMRDEACRATRALGVQPEAALDRRLLCLNRRLGELDRLAQLLERADARMVERGVRAAYDLPTVADCSEARTAALRPPDDAGLRARVEAARGRLDQGWALKLAGRFADGAAVVRLVALEAQALGFQPLIAEALHDRGNLEAIGGDLRTAQATFAAEAGAALAAQDLEGAADAWLELAAVTGHDLAGYAEAHRWLKMAEPALVRGGKQEISYERQLGTLLKDEGELDAVRPHYERALALATQLLGPEHPDTGEVTNDLGTLALARNDLADAKQKFERALEIARRAYGDGHPFLSVALANLGAVACDEGKYDECLGYARRVLAIAEKVRGPESHEAEQALVQIGLAEDARGHDDAALTAYRRALEIAEKTSGPEHPDVAELLTGIGGVDHRRGRSAEALAMNERALAIRTKALGADHPDTAQSLINIGLELKVMGRYPEALDRYQRGLAIYERRLGADNPAVGALLDNLGEVQRLMGAVPAAVATYQRALAICEAGFGRDHPVTADVLTGLGRSDNDLGRFAQARPLLERALAIRANDPPDDTNLAETRFALAQALAADAAARARARDLAAQARAVYAAAGPARARQLAEVDAWLRRVSGAFPASSRRP